MTIILIEILFNRVFDLIVIFREIPVQIHSFTLRHPAIHIKINRQSKMSPGSASKRSLRALEMLDKQISKRSLRSNDPSQNNMPWMGNYNTNKSLSNNQPLLSPQKSNNIVVSPNSNRTINRLNESPTPKRRKLTATRTTSPAKGSPQQDNPLLDTADEDAHISETLSSSPIKKMVAFSDTIEIESSQTQRGIPDSPDKFTENLQKNGSIVVTSSPRSPQYNSKRPVKSILKHNINLENKQSSNLAFKTDTDGVHTRPAIITQHSQYNKNNIHNNLSDTTNLNSTENPFNIEFWTKGFIHSLSRQNNIEEFKNIITGGLSILQNNTEPYNKKRFEIYATFNNILSITSDKKNAELDDKRTSVIIENFVQVSKVAISHWNSIQLNLLTNDGITDPFQTRLYVQIVKFFTIILSNFKIVSWISTNKNVQSEVNKVFRLSKDALINKNSNKQIVNYNLTFLSKQKFYNYCPSMDEVQSLITMIPDIKEIKSKSYMKEKILFIRSLLVSFPEQMINNMDIWLCGEILPRILIEDDMYSEAIMVNSTSLLSVLMMKLLDTNDSKVKDLYTIITQKPINDILPQKFLARVKDASFSSQSLPSDMNTEVQTLETLIHSHILYLLQMENDQSKHKRAVDFWMTLVGILFSNYTTLKDFIHMDINENKWLKLNKTAFESNNPETKFIALKSWRILIYHICMNIHKFSQRNQAKCFRILKIPFEMSAAAPCDSAVSKGVPYCISAITYITVCIFSNSTLNEDDFIHIFKRVWENLLTPIYSIIPSLQLPQSQSKKIVFDILTKLLGGECLTELRSPNKNKSVKANTPTNKQLPFIVVASDGIPINDIPPLPLQSHPDLFIIVKNFMFDVIRKHGDEVDCSTLITILIQSVPDFLINSEIFTELQDILSYYLKNCCRPPINSTDLFYSFTFTLFIKFSSLIFTEENYNLESYFKGFSKIFPNLNDIIVRLMKDIIKSTRNHVSEFLVFYKFLATDDENCKKYTVNWLSSTLLSPKMDQKDLTIFMRIIDIVPNISMIDNLLTIFPRMDQQYFKLVHSSCILWGSFSLEHFIEGCLSINDQRVHDFVLNLIKEVQLTRNHTFNALLPLLHDRKLNEFIQECYLENPITLEYINPEYLQYIDFSKSTRASVSSFLLANVSRIPEEKRLYILGHLLKEEGLDSMTRYSELFSSILFEPSNKVPIDEKQKAILHLFEKAYEENNWKALNTVMEQSLQLSNFDHIEMFFSNHKYHIFDIMIHFPNNLTVTLSTIDLKIKDLIYEAISQLLQSKDQDYAISLVKSFLNSHKYTELGKLSNALMQLLFNSTDTSPESQKYKKLKLFREILTNFRKNKRSCLVDLLDSFMSNFPVAKSAYLTKLMKIVPEILGKGNWKSDIKGNLEKVYAELETLEQNVFEDVQEKFESVPQDFVDIPEDFEDAQDEFEDAQEVFDDIHEDDENINGNIPQTSSEVQSQLNAKGKNYSIDVQVPATQKSNLSSQAHTFTKSVETGSPGSLSTGNIITSSNSLSSYDDTKTEKGNKSDISKMQSQPTFISNSDSPSSKTQSFQSEKNDHVKKTEQTETNIMEKEEIATSPHEEDLEKVEEPISSFPEITRNSSTKLFGISDASSTIEEIERMSQLEKVKPKASHQSESGIDIHSLFESSLDPDNKKSSKVRTVGKRPFSSPVSKYNYEIHQSHVSSLSSPLKKKRASSITNEVESPLKRPTREHKSDQKPNECPNVDDNVIISSEILTTKEKENEAYREKSRKSVDNINLLLQGQDKADTSNKPNENMVLVKKYDEIELSTRDEIGSTQGKKSDTKSGRYNYEASIDETNVASNTAVRDCENKTKTIINNTVEHNHATNSTAALQKESNTDYTEAKASLLTNDALSSEESVIGQSQTNLANVSASIPRSEEHNVSTFTTANGQDHTDNVDNNENEDMSKNSELPKPSSVEQVRLLHKLKSESERSDEKYVLEDVKSKQAIRIPIFNSMKLAEKRSHHQNSDVVPHTVSDVPVQTEVQTPYPHSVQLVADSSVEILAQVDSLNVQKSVLSLNVNEEEQHNKSEAIEVNTHDTEEGDLESSYMTDNKEQNDTDVDNTSRESTPSLKVHFPSKKTRKLVNRLHNFSTTELAAIPIAERRNLRVELLDFMMKLEYYNTDET